MVAPQKILDFRPLAVTQDKMSGVKVGQALSDIENAMYALITNTTVLIPDKQ